jgi:hypothetical protein
MIDRTSNYVNNIFEQPWWLDVVAPNSWEEILIEDNGEIVARWPIVHKGHKIGMPYLTQTLGFWISEKTYAFDNHFNKRKKIINSLLEKLPKDKNINIRLSSRVTYILPMHWRQFIINPLISYRFENISDTEQIYNNFNNTVKKNIKSASKKVKVESIDDINPLLVLLKKMFQRQKRGNPIPNNIIKGIYNACKDHNACKLLYAIGNNNTIESGCLLVFDEQISYLLISATDPEFKNSGVNSLLIWEAIKFASTVSKSFDFEGSMIEGIENFIRQFGSTPVVYFQIRKQNIILELLELIKPKVKKLIGYKI